VVSFSVQTTTTSGNASISLFSGQAFGEMSLYARAGAPYGNISVKPYATQLIANGSSQTSFTFDTITDQFGNIVEDGTQIPITMVGGGNLSIDGIVFMPSIIATTSTGSAIFFAEAPTVVGSSDIQVRANPSYNSSNELTGYLATADFPISFIAGQPAGIIPAVPSNGVYSINVNNAISNIVVGPVVDLYQNVVAANTQVQFSISNGQAAEPITSLYTDSNGMASFFIEGDGTRGPLTLSFTSATAQGTLQMWAIANSHLTLTGQIRDDIGTSGGISTGSGRIYYTYGAATGSATDLPMPVSSALPVNWGIWDEIFDYTKVSAEDGQYYPLAHINGNPIGTVGNEVQGAAAALPLIIPTPASSGASTVEPIIIDIQPASSGGSSPLLVPEFDSAIYYHAGSLLMRSPYCESSDPTWLTTNG